MNSSPARDRAAETPALECRRLSVGYDARIVLDGVDFAVAPGESLAVLGPSGSGKTTLLYAIAGFVEPTAGEIRVAGRTVAAPTRSDPPERRDVGVVFQHYALWPHMTALDTVAYPLRRRGLAAAEAHREAAALLDRLGLGQLADRRPDRLSGGEQQRVGLARALARRAGLYLFDEPTAHLDTPLRAALQEELSAQRRLLGAAAVYATHDVAEALAIADRVALLGSGCFAQVGSPRMVYEEPVDLWAARLTGPASLLAAHVTGFANGRVRLRPDRPSSADGEIEAAGGAAPTVDSGANGRALVRPDWARLGGPLPATIADVWYRGTHTDYALETALGGILVRQPGPPTASPGSAVTWGLERAWVVPDPGETAVGGWTDLDPGAPPNAQPAGRPVS